MANPPSSSPCLSPPTAMEHFLPSARVMHNAVRLSLLAYEKEENLLDWASGKDIRLKSGGGPQFGGNFPTDSFSHRHVVTFGLDEQGRHHKVQWVYCHDGDVLYVAFKGSDNATDFLLDASLSDVVTPSGCRMHSGFYSGIQSEISSVLAKVLKSTRKEVVFCGHSLGGAYATAVTLELASHPCWPDGLKAQAVTFGSPLVVCQGALPARLATRPPMMTHVVGNFDIVPRVLCLEREAIIHLLEVMPAVMSSALKTIASIARQAGFVKMGSVVDSVKHMRETFTAVGTYVFGQTAVLPERGNTYIRRTNVTIVPPDNVSAGGSLNTAAKHYLRFLPTLEPSSKTFRDASASRTAFVQSCIADHSLNVYWPLVEHMTRDSKDWQSALSRHKLSTETPWDRTCDVHEPLRHAFENYSLTTALNVPVPSKEMLSVMPGELQTEWEALWRKMEALSNRTKDAARAALDNVPEEKKTREITGAKDLVPKLVESASLRTACDPVFSPRAPVPWLVNVTGDPLVVAIKNGHAAETVPSEGCLHLATWCSAGDTLVINEAVEFTVPLNSHKKHETRVLTAEASGIAGILVWDSSIVPEDAPEDPLEADPQAAGTTGTATAAVPEAADEKNAPAAAGAKPKESSSRLPHFGVRSRVKQLAGHVMSMDSAAKPKPEAKNPTEPPPAAAGAVDAAGSVQSDPSTPCGKPVRRDRRVAGSGLLVVDHQVFHLHNFARFTAEKTLAVSWSAVDKDPNGVGMLPSQFSRDDQCASCPAKFSTFGVSTGRHHCRGCGGSLCEACSGEYWNFINYTEKQRICAGCAERFAQAHLPAPVVD
ncbi:Protein EDS1B [Diplonema papillatum]|nr:Protein EDS1B [Diplonema papillatum]